MQQFLQFVILTFIYSSTCFGCPHAHHQEAAVAASGFTFGALLSPRSLGKTRGCYRSCWAPNDGHEDARNILSCK